MTSPVPGAVEIRPEVALGHPALQARSMCEAFQLTAAERVEPGGAADDGGWRVDHFARYAERVKRLATGFHALGVRRGDTVAFMLTNRPEFHRARRPVRITA